MFTTNNQSPLPLSSCHLLANTMPVSDNNVSTTNMTHWAEIGDSEQDINVSFLRNYSVRVLIFISFR